MEIAILTKIQMWIFPDHAGYFQLVDPWIITATSSLVDYYYWSNFFVYSSWENSHSDFVYLELLLLNEGSFPWKKNDLISQFCDWSSQKTEITHQETVYIIVSFREKWLKIPNLVTEVPKKQQ